MNDINNTPRKVTAVYALLTLSLFVCLIPSLAFIYLSMFLFVGTLLAAYIFRAESEKKDEELQAQHMTYIIRTIWIMSLFSFVTIGLASAYMIPQLDFSQMSACTAEVTAHLDPENPDYDAMNELMQPCMDDFIASNKMPMGLGLLISAGPLVLYTLMRLFKGFSRARKGQGFDNVKAWF